ncbi:hypothetical protein TrLO_g8378 [Triparma laevis f. longispina]|uniref:Uncharacterized protein n=1 Tax=Triparma laevis f. longispina TaxID=1714387 RepID=A0A9W7C4X2_9STRA|nr:hypothetical protein TrLO_g8378 [Triparma laevis f. longispina]
MSKRPYLESFLAELFGVFLCPSFTFEYDNPKNIVSIYQSTINQPPQKRRIVKASSSFSTADVDPCVENCGATVLPSSSSSVTSITESGSLYNSKSTNTVEISKTSSTNASRMGSWHSHDNYKSELYDMKGTSLTDKRGESVSYLSSLSNSSEPMEFGNKEGRFSM